MDGQKSFRSVRCLGRAVAEVWEVCWRVADEAGFFESDAQRQCP